MVLPPILAVLISYGIMSCWWTGIPVYEALVDKRYPSGEKIMQSSKTEFCIKWIILSTLLLPITFVSLFMRRDLVVAKVVNSIMSE